MSVEASLSVARAAAYNYTPVARPGLLIHGLCAQLASPGGGTKDSTTPKPSPVGLGRRRPSKVSPCIKVI